MLNFLSCGFYDNHPASMPNISLPIATTCCSVATGVGGFAVGRLLLCVFSVSGGIMYVFLLQGDVVVEDL